MRAIIMANGDGTRWGNYEGVPKHLCDPERSGENLLQRLTRQLDGEDVYVIGPPEYRQYIGGAWLHSPEQGDGDEWLGATKFVNTRPFWSDTVRTVIFYGDVYFTDEAIDQILSNTERLWLNWCRFGRSALTGTRWGENFAVSFWPEHRAAYSEAIDVAVRAHMKGWTRRSGGWEIARAMAGARGRQIKRHVRWDLYREINDWTEDFDFPEDLDKWRDRWFHQGSRS